MSRQQFTERITEDLARRANIAEVKRYLPEGESHGCNHRSITKRMQKQKRRIYG